MHYFPDADAPALQPFTRAFVRLMFAHGEFERRVSDLMGVITFDPTFGEQPENRLSARARPKAMKKLIKEHQSKHVDGIPEGSDIVACLRGAIPPSDVRNMLAHGHWWAFDVDTETITVRATTARPNEELHRDFTEEDIQRTVTSFEDLEAELFALQRQIERRRRR
ncbi:hypothetical protein I6F35_12255 [Bradyrhizobium sp. BRP22]|uniref:hypothetical protein n=1 Tax=Bradyrhizobium sp. BRP22 TaxID=2793821 RepID=UPI001CD60CFE|nr:hypothetical protein [Bradyrhizobium sp. BRP22]MCA1453984.1 hypothetical protein [Bradyrhizobium sp. BRP22]